MGTDICKLSIFVTVLICWSPALGAPSKSSYQEFTAQPNYESQRMDHFEKNCDHPNCRNSMNNWNEWEDHERKGYTLAVGWIIAIVMTTLLSFVGITFAICFFCVCCKEIRDRITPQVALGPGPSVQPPPPEQ